jgi:hypothetical protein
MRAGLAAVTTPKFDAVRLLETAANCVWFSALNDSSLNWSLTPRVTVKFLKSARSRLFTPGPRSVFRPRFPSCPSPGCANAEVLNYRFTVRSPGFGSPTRSARFVPNVSLRPPRSAATIVRGNPCCQV